MDRVDVCVYNQSIYNLDDLSVLGKLPIGNSIILYEYLTIIKQEHDIRLAIMDFNHLLRNALYCVFPDVTIIIQPLEVMKMISNYLGCAESSHDQEQEIAAGIEEKQLIIPTRSCLGIYNYHTKAEAIHYYRQWQGNVPMGIKCFHNVIRTIDYYHEEIFNYFELQNIIQEKTL